MSPSVTKRERKYGKKDIELDTTDSDEIMYKILIDMANFTQQMSYEECQKYITKKCEQAHRENRQPPSMMIVKV